MRTPAPLVVAAALTAALTSGCSGDDGPTPRDLAASAPVPGVTLPPDALLDLVPRPTEVPPGMVPVLTGSGRRDIATVAGYSGTGAAATAAEARLKAHGFAGAYVAQYAHPTSGQVLSVVASEFATAEGATADYADDQKDQSGTAVAGAETVGEASSVRVQDLPGSPASQLVLVRFRSGTHTWSLAYKATPTADPQVGTAIAKVLASRATA